MKSWVKACWNKLMGGIYGNPLCEGAAQGDIGKVGSQTMKECSISLGLEYQNRKLGLH